MLWASLIAMTVLAAFLTLWPLVLRTSIPDNSRSEIDFYLTQLSEVERDIERGQLPRAEADAARAEIGRRLIGLQKEKTARHPFLDKPQHRWLALGFGLLLLPLSSAALYSLYGYPGLKDMPLASREDVDNEVDPITTAIARIEADIVANPENLKAWSTLAPVYLRLGRYPDAVIAYRKILQIKGEDASTRAHLGEAQVAAANGLVTQEAKANLTQAFEADPSLSMAQYYLALGIEQSGDIAKAIAIYESVLEKVADRPNWVKVIKTKIAGLKNEAPPEQEKNANPAPADNEMILGMVARLAARLESEGGSVDDWVRLIRSYSVIAKKLEAEQALDNARKQFANDTSATAQLQSIAREFGLNGR